MVSDVTRVKRATTRCRACGHGLHAGEQFCEQCGEPADEEASAWVATVIADPEYFAALAPANVTFPQHPIPARTIALDRDELTIGRSTDTHAPCIAVDDPAASREHACLRRQADGTYAVVDVKSANGTCINGNLTPIARSVPVVLTAGDRIHVGAWTTITVSLVDDGQENVSS